MLILLPIILSLFVLFIPGITFLSWPKNILSLLPYFSRVILWSMSINILLSLVFSFLGLPPYLTLISSFLLFGIFFIKYRTTPTKKQFIHITSFMIVFLLLFVAFAIPFLLLQNGLPTGDSQKSIYWADYIINNQSLPNYSLSIDALNRDPVDFYTPGLHSLTAIVMQATSSFSPPPLSLTSIGFLAISLALGISVIGTTIGTLVIRGRSPLMLILIIPLLILTNIRFLRYLAEPGYHLQNILGELLLFGLLFLVISILKKCHIADLILFFLIIITLFISHQFSAFLAGLSISPALVVVFIKYKKQIFTYLTSHVLLRAVIAVSFLLFAILAFSLKLHHKISHIFTTNPHLISSTPNFLDYFQKMGSVFFLFGAIGLILLLISFFQNRTNYPLLTFTLTSLVLMILTQGPRLFIDIPAIRTLFYSVVPLSIGFAYLVLILAVKISKTNRKSLRYSLYASLLLIILIPSYSSTVSAYNVSHKIRTNSTLLSEHLSIISNLKNISSSPSSAILVDDYNRRSSSWMILSEQPTFSRLSSNIRRAMAEASQSSIRRQIYLKNLDFEKIFSLGSFPEIIKLLDKHNIEYVTGIDKSSYLAFSHNPLLRAVTKGGDLTVFQRLPTANDNKARDNLSSLPPNVSAWLLRPSTLTNDIGDPEDTYKHLPASILATRLSEPRANKSITYRTTSAPLIPISFNANAYVSALWDQDNSGFPDTSLQIVIKTLNPKQSLVIETINGQTFNVPGDGTPVTIPASHVNLDDNESFTVNIQNPTQKFINIDLIALGLSQVP